MILKNKFFKKKHNIHIIFALEILKRLLTLGHSTNIVQNRTRGYLFLIHKRVPKSTLLSNRSYSSKGRSKNFKPTRDISEKSRRMNMEK